MKILFEKFSGNNILNSWTKLFNDIDELLKFMEDNKEYLLGENYSLKIRTVEEYKNE